MSELREKFLAAENKVRDNHYQIPEPLKLKLYGLAKQIKEGDCQVPEPPSTNTILKAKWDAWTACAGLPAAKAMNDYINIVDTLEPNLHPSLAKKVVLEESKINTNPLNSAIDVTTSAPQRRGSATTVGIRKQGVLYKQRDVFKGWRPRHFVLSDSLLHYYIDINDAIPRHTLDISGCSVTSIKPVTLDGVEYFPFSISHPKSKTPYNLASDSKLDADVWVSKILEAASLPTTGVAEDDNSSSINIIKNESVPSQSYPVTKFTAHLKETQNCIPSAMGNKVERAVQLVLDECKGEDDSDWNTFHEKDGIVAKKKNLGTSNISVKSETVLPYSLFDIFTLVTDIERQKPLHLQLVAHEMLHEYSYHSWVEYLKYKAAWPYSARDYVRLVHWRLLQDNSVVVVSFSDSSNLDSFRTNKDSATIRGEIIVMGYHLSTTNAGTKVKHIVQMDFKGSLSNSWINSASQHYGVILSQLKKTLDTEKAEGTLNKSSATTISDYAALITYAANSKNRALLDSSLGASSNKDNTASTTNLSSNKVNGEKVINSSQRGDDGDKDDNISPYRKASMLKNETGSGYISKASYTVAILPFLLIYLVESRMKVIAFIGGLAIAYNYLVKLTLGTPITKSTKRYTDKLPAGKFLFRFPVELTKLVQYLEKKRSDNSAEVTFTHIIAKACAMVLYEQPRLNGYIINNNFYLSKQPGVDLSVSLEVSDRESVALKVTDAAIKPLETVADEIIKKSDQLRKESPHNDSINAFYDKIDAYVPIIFAAYMKKWLYSLGSELGLHFPQYGIVAHPLGVINIITSPNSDGESDIDIAHITNQDSSVTPITVTMGGLRVLPALGVEKKLAGITVLNFAVSINSAAASIGEGRLFVSKLQEYLKDPFVLDKLHQKAVFERKEQEQRKIYKNN